MKGAGAIGVTIGGICVAVSILSVLIPQKRTRRILSFVIGLFFIVNVTQGLIIAVRGLRIAPPAPCALQTSRYSEEDYNRTVGQMTADQLNDALRELLQNEGIHAEQILLRLKISDEGRITVSQVVIYITEAYAGRTNDIEQIVYRNVAKEPEIYVAGKKVR